MTNKPVFRWGILHKPIDSYKPIDLYIYIYIYVYTRVNREIDVCVCTLL